MTDAHPGHAAPVVALHAQDGEAAGEGPRRGQKLPAELPAAVRELLQGVTHVGHQHGVTGAGVRPRLPAQRQVRGVAGRRPVGPPVVVLPEAVEVAAHPTHFAGVRRREFQVDGAGVVVRDEDSVVRLHGDDGRVVTDFDRGSKEGEGEAPPHTVDLVVQGIVRVEINVSRQDLRVR